MSKQELEAIAEMVMISFYKEDGFLNSEIASSNVYDCQEINRDFRSYLTANKLIPGEVLFNYRTSLRSFTPSAFHYVFGQFLFYGLKNPASEVMDFIIYLFSELDIDDAFYKERLSLFTSEQLEIVKTAIMFFKFNECMTDAYLEKKIDEAIEGIGVYKKARSGGD